MPTTTRWPRASSPLSNESSSTFTRGRAVRKRGVRSPSTSRVSTKPDADTPRSVGTRAERQRYTNRDGGYFMNDYQVVSDEEAANIADALERALDDVPDEGGGDHLLTPAQYQAAQRDELSQEELDKAIEQFMERRAASPPQIPPQTPASYFAGEKDYLREFIAFCRAGAFSIG